jgi:isopenicillin N synthase-like dioxygenase
MGSEQDKGRPNVWVPEETLRGFRPIMTEFYWECFNLASDILRAITLGIELQGEDHLLKLHGGHNNRLSLLHYPSLPEETLRIPKQTDWGSITIRFQDDYSGLEVEDINSTGTFIPATSVKNAVIVNVGDLLQRWSNGK